MGNRKSETLRKEKVKKRDITMQQLGREAKAKYEKKMAGRKTILVPHPTLPKTFIEKVITE